MVKAKSKSYKVIWINEINVAGIKRQTDDILESVETPEITALVKHKYLCEV